ncbi:MAG: FG-GAP-like repeat-containing protein [Verrucomicrobiota bacterium]|nr:FG-GAP-like repeat-containing protein [Verrucomicrobiota bacterium]
MAVCLLSQVLPATNWVEEGSHRWRTLDFAHGGTPGFSRLNPSATGIHFSNELDLEKSLQNQVYLNGSGVALGDVDGDGWCDIYLCGLDSPNHLYLNRGDWKFEEVARAYEIDCAGKDSTGAALADLDGDSDLDLIVNTIHSGTLLFRNDGDGFTPVRDKEAELALGRGGMSLAIADIDADGRLDFYVTHYRDTTLMDMPNTHFNFRTAGGRRVISTVDGVPVKGSRFENRFRLNERGGIEENGLPDVLYRNLGQFRFERHVAGGKRFLNSRGMPMHGALLEWGLSVMFRDINRDGKPDIYVCNDFDGRDRFWLNAGKGQFREAPALALRKTSMFSMGVDFADINRDGFDDFFVVDMLNTNHRTRKNQMVPRLQYHPVPGRYNDRPQWMHNTMFINRGLGLFSEIAHYSGVAASDWSWCSIFIDVDLDGLEDLLITNGVERNARHLDTIIHLRKQREGKDLSKQEILLARRVFPAQATANAAFRNQADLRFTRNATEWGFDDEEISHGMACGDLDGDGDLDLVVNNLRAPAGIYRNNIAKPRLAVRLNGPPGNTAGIGARIEVEHAAQTQSQEMIAGGRYLSSDDQMRVFAMPGGTAQLKIIWPDLKQTVVGKAEPNRLYQVRYQAAKVVPPHEKPTPTLFKQIDFAEAQQHVEASTSKSQTQPLLPWQLGQDGPGAAWGDLDGDGWEDLIIANGRGGSTKMYRNNAGRRFSLLDQETPFPKSARDALAVLAISGQLLQSFSNHDDGLAFGDMVTVSQPDGSIQQKIGAKAASAGQLAMADVDGDGDLDLLVTARAMPDRYPEPVASWIYLNEGGVWQESADWSSSLRHVGQVSGAVFADIDSNSTPDLLLGCDWGAPRILINTGSRFVDQTEQLGLDKFTGFWRGVDVGDFNGDGRIDFVVANRGLNAGYKASMEEPFVAFYGDLDEDSRGEIIETVRENNNLHPRRNLSTLNNAMPWLTEHLRNYDQYAKLTVNGLSGPARLAKASRIEITTLQSMVFLQSDIGFEAQPLPPEAQFTSAFSPVVADFDNDGFEDIALSQNEFAVHSEESRLDAGFGLLLSGRGDGSFEAREIRESGLAVFGEGRGAAAADFNHDGRTDLVICQNGAKPKLFLNQTKHPGLRVRLQFGEANLEGVGAIIRLGRNGNLGPARVLRLGSGFLSQNATTQVLGSVEDATSLLVAWPNGENERFELKPGQMEITATKGQGSAVAD